MSLIHMKESKSNEKLGTPSSLPHWLRPKSPGHVPN